MAKKKKVSKRAKKRLLFLLKKSKNLAGMSTQQDFKLFLHYKSDKIIEALEMILVLLYNIVRIRAKRTVKLCA